MIPAKRADLAATSSVISPPTGRKDTEKSVPSTHDTVQIPTEIQDDYSDFKKFEKYKAIVREYCQKSEASLIRLKFSPYRPKQAISQVY